jgi:cell division protease FtsH
VSNLFRNLLFALLFLAAMAIVFGQLHPGAKTLDLSFSDFNEYAKNGAIKEMTFKGQTATGIFKEPQKGYSQFATVLPADLLNYSTDLANKYGVQIKSEKPSDGQLSLLLIVLLPVLLIIGFGVIFMRQVTAGGNKALSFGKSRARISGGKGKTTFKDVAGIDEVKEELTEIIDFLKDPKRFQKLGGRIPRGVLLMGPPGTGKTLLAKAVAGEAGVPFYSISGSEFVEMFVGVGASRVRDLFDQGKKNCPCIIYIDEIDAVGRHRGAGMGGGGHDEREQTLNQLLVEMDGFDTGDTVIVMAATNRPDVLDPALLRPGRFDRRIVVPRPDQRGREEILRVHTAKVPLDPKVDLGTIARGTPGFSGADLANLVNEAALLAARYNQKAVVQADFENAKDKVLMGPERRSLLMSDTEKKTTAYHETGHTLVGYFSPSSDPLHKVTIIPRGRALGVTWRLPMAERFNESRDTLLASITVAMGGRAAEEIYLGQVTTGASNDLEQATEIARRMVMAWGMSERLGPLNFWDESPNIFLGQEMGGKSQYSEATAVAIDEEVKRIITECDKKARAILTEKGELVHRVAQALLERETLDGEEIKRLVEGLPLDAKVMSAHPPADAPAPEDEAKSEAKPKGKLRAKPQTA